MIRKQATSDSGVDAHTEIRDKDIQRFRSAARRLATVIADIRRYCPGANLYNTPGRLHLMSGPTHNDGDGNAPLYDNVVDDIAVPTLSGGDW
jgi:hypothetical protein